MRLLGVLQRIGLCYFFTSVLFLNFNLRGMIAAFVALLAGYWALMTFVPYPGIGAGSFAPDTNLANWIDAITCRTALGHYPRSGRPAVDVAGDRHLSARRVRRPSAEE